MVAAPTIHDVALAAGVSTSTVSRALSRPERVNAATRSRVQQVATELGYQPSPHARSLLSGHSMTLALLLPDITNPFFFGLIRGTQHRAAEAGYLEILLDTEESGIAEAERLAALRKAVGGVVVAASRLSDAELAAIAGRQPLVALNREARGVDSVIIDTPTAYAEAIGHLAALGHRVFGYAAGPASSWSDGRRWRACRRTARSLGVTMTKLGPFPPTRPGGAAAADALLDIGATAVLAFNDLEALGILRRLTERGVAVPGRISVVGCDDIFGADFSHPPLTTIAGPVEQVGRLAVERLLEILADPEKPRGTWRVLPSTLVVRGSTGPPPTDAPPAAPVPSGPPPARTRKNRPATEGVR